MKKIICIIVAAVLLIGIGVGFFFIMQDEEPIDESKVLRIWSAPPLMGDTYDAALKIDPNSYSAKYTKYVIEEFKKVYPDVKIQYEAKGWAEQLNENIIRSANVLQPDIVGTETYAQNLIDLDYFAPVEWSKETYDDFLPFTIDAYTRDGKLYATPAYTNVCAFLYNEQMLIKAGCPIKINDEGEQELIVPETWAEVLYCCEKVDTYLNSADFLGHSGGMNATEKAKYGAYIINNERGIAAGFRGELYLQIAGGSMVKDGALNGSIGAQDVSLDTDANVDGFTLMSELYGYSSTGAYLLDEPTVSTALLKGDAAMTVDIAAWLTAGAAEGVTIKAAPIPVLSYTAEGDAVIAPYAYTENNRDGVHNTNVKGERANVAVGNVAYAITKKSDKKEMAQKFIEICISNQAQAYLLGLDYRAPSTISGCEYVLDDEKLVAMKDTFGDAAYNKTKASRDLIRTTIESALNSANGNENIAGGLACFSKNINLCWTHYETYMRKIYHDVANGASKSLIKSELTVLSNSIKQELS